MIGVDIEFRNRPNSDGTVSTFTVTDCLIAPNGSPTSTRKQIIIHLPKSSDERVDGAWVGHDGDMYHIIGMTPKGIIENTPSRWNRYCIAEKIY